MPTSSFHERVRYFNLSLEEPEILMTRHLDSSIDNPEFDASVPTAVSRGGGTVSAGFRPGSPYGELQNLHVPGDEIHRGHRLPESSHNAAEDRQ